MASIATTISLYDRISAPLNNIMTTLDRMCGVFESVDGAMEGAFNPDTIQSIRQPLNSAIEQLNQIGNEQEEFNRRISQGANEMDGLSNKLMGMVGAYASIQGLGKLVNLSDDYIQTNARLKFIVDDGGSIDELEQKIFASAQRSRASYQMTADSVAKLQMQAGAAFKTNDETIAFAENLNKLFVIAGTEQQGIASASLQLTQALGSGVLRGEEFNAVFEAAPNIMQTVADYMDVPIGKLRGMAAEGQITADIVKNALLGATADINEQFNQMPMTWGQVWTGLMNRLYMASVPVLKIINALAQNWSIIEPIVIGVASALAVYLAATKGVELATKAWAAAQAFLNGVMAMNPVVIITMAIILLISLIYAAIAAYNKFTGSTVSATGVVAGAIMAAIAFVWNLFLGLLDLVLGVVNYMANPWIAFANFFANLFNDPIGSIIHLFGDLADNVLGILETIASAIDKLFGSNLAGAVSGWREGLSGKVEEWAQKYGNGTYEAVADNINLSSESLGLKRWAYSDAYKTGYDWGDSSGILGDDVKQAEIETAANTSAIADSVGVATEDLKYLRDIAERDVINRFTTAEIKVEMNNTNSISSNMDLDGMVDYLASGVNEAMERAAEGVHE